jgi:hypothetical protein
MFCARSRMLTLGGCHDGSLLSDVERIITPLLRTLITVAFSQIRLWYCECPVSPSRRAPMCPFGKQTIRSDTVHISRLPPTAPIDGEDDEATTQVAEPGETSASQHDSVVIAHVDRRMDQMEQISVGCLESTPCIYPRVFLPAR